MKAKIDYTHKRGLPGGPNEQFTYVTGIFSVDGYRNDSPDVNNPFNVIPSGRISMREHDGTPLKKGPILGVDNLGNKKIMLPGNEYQFPGDEVFETPLDQYPDGGTVYTYPGRPGSYYKKDGNKWLISNANTGGKYIPIKDPDGTRSANLNKGAVVALANPTVTQRQKIDAILPSYNNSPMVMSVKGRTQNEREIVDKDIQTQVFLDKMQKEADQRLKTGTPQHEQPLDMMDWLWGAAVAAPVALSAAGELAAMQIPYTGISWGTALNTVGAAHGISEAPERVQDWKDVAEGKKTWQEAAIKTVGTAAELYGGKSAFDELAPAVRNTYVNIAEGANPFNKAWRSPASSYDNLVERAYYDYEMPQSKELFDNLAANNSLTQQEKLLLKRYEVNSRSFTGRGGQSIDVDARSQLDDLIGKSTITSEKPVVLSRRINSSDADLFDNSGIYQPGRPTSWSAGRDNIGNVNYSGSADRMVVKLQPGEHNMLKNPYQALTDDDLAVYASQLKQQGMAQDQIDWQLSFMRGNRTNERELLLPSSSNFRQIGKVKNKIGGYDFIMQPFKDGGSLKQYPGGGDLRKGIEKGNVYASGFYTDPLTGSYVPSANIGFQTALIGGKRKSGWTLGAQVGLPYEKFDENSIDMNASYNDMLPDIYGKLPITAGISASYLGTVNNYGGQGRGYIDMKADYNPHSGLGASLLGGPQFHFGDPYRRSGELRPGKAYGTITPFGGFALNTRPASEEGEIKNTSGITYGVKAEAEWKPEIFRKVPISIYGKGMFSASPGFGKKDDVIGDVDVFTGNGVQTVQADSTDNLSARYGVSGELGIRIPVQKIKQNMPSVNIANLNLPKINKPNIDIPEVSPEETQIEGDINGGYLGRRVNASTPEGEEIFVGQNKNLLPKIIPIEIPKEEKQEGGELDLYKKYINGEFDGTPEELEAKKIYDKLNRVYYKPAKEAGMSVPNYIMSNVLTL